MRQAYVDDLETEFAAGKTLLRHGANGLVPLAEAKLRGEPVSIDAVAEATKGLLLQVHGQEIDTVVLACTHFPLLADELHAALGRELTFVDGSEGIARRIAQLTRDQAFERSNPDRAVTTGDLAEFRRLADAFAGYGIARLEKF